MSRSKYSAKQKYKILEEYNTGTKLLQTIIYKYDIDKSTFYDWRYKYNKYGFEGLKESKTRKRYSKELKEEVVQNYLSGKFSLRELARKYELSSKSMVQRWVKRYNSHRGLKATPKGRTKSMAKGRSTTWKERIKIVINCIANDINYKQTAEKHQVSYQQVYQWVKKYKSDGVDALKDRRGRKKSKEELNSEEKNKLKIKKLELENEKLKTENDFLKKLGELERRRF